MTKMIQLLRDTLTGLFAGTLRIIEAVDKTDVCGVSSADPGSG